MPPIAIAAAMAVAGGVAGAAANHKEGGHDTGNIYDPAVNAMGGAEGAGKSMQDEIQAQKSYTGDPTKEFQNNSIFGQTYGKGGIYDQTAQQEQDQANKGFSLKPEDYEAYGQGSANISRMFGQQDQSLAQSLSNRGLSNSGVAGAAFTGLQGNKNEQLAGLQMNIANQRMQMNQERLNNTRQFLGQLGQQGLQGINQTQQLGREQAQDSNSANMDKFNMQNSLLKNFQGQKNEQLQQQQQTQHASDFSNIFGGVTNGFMKGMSMGGGGAAGGAGGMSGGGNV